MCLWIRTNRTAKSLRRDWSESVTLRYGIACVYAVCAALVSVTAIEKMGVLRVPPLDELGTPMEIVGMFGDKEQYQQALRELMEQLYDTAA